MKPTSVGAAARAAKRGVAALLASTLGVLLLGGGGCELAVGDTIPLFLCEPGLGTCPSGQVCAPGTHRCVPRPQACTVGSCPENMQCDDGTLACVPIDGSVVSDAAPGDDGSETSIEAEANVGEAGANAADASVPADDSAPADASVAEASARCRTIGCGCSSARDCNSGLCVTQPGPVTRDIWIDAHRRSFCSKPCCTSNECDAGSICFATAVGGDYCVPAGWLIDRAPTPGAMIGGEECRQGSDCRSGLCASGSCADTCCSGRSTNQCGLGTACRFGDFPGIDFDTHHTAHCEPQPAGGSPNGTDCTSNGACRSNLCVSAGIGFVTCHDACRGAGDCTDQSQVCSYIASGNTSDVFAACVSINGNSFGNTPQQGSTCKGASDCQSGLCDSAGQCTDVCFADSDCTVAGWHCRPANLPILGGGGGTYWVLTCGP